MVDAAAPARPLLDRPVDLVIFDCDGVLVDSEVISTRVIVQSLQALGYPIDEPTAARRFVGRSYQAMVAELEAEQIVTLPLDFIAQVEAATLAMLEQELQPTRGIETALRLLDRPCCVASSSSLPWIRACLAWTDLAQAFGDNLFSASMVVRGKPAPDLFLHAAQAMGVPPARCLVVEDSTAGVKAAVAAGMAVLGFVGGSHMAEAAISAAALQGLGADQVIDDLALLPGLLATGPAA